MAAIPSTHPGEELLEILDELNFSIESFARETGISVDLVNRIVEAQHPITPDIAARVAKVLDMTPDSWLHLQLLHDEDMKREESSVIGRVPEEVVR